MKLVTFQLDHETYALPIEDVQSIETVLPIRRVPLTSEDTLGVINLRGVVMTVKDLRVTLGMPATEVSEQSRLIIAKQKAYLVDAAESIVECEEEEIQKVENIEHNAVQGVVRYNDILVTLLKL